MSIENNKNNPSITKNKLRRTVKALLPLIAIASLASCSFETDNLPPTKYNNSAEALDAINKAESEKLTTDENKIMSVIEGSTATFRDAAVRRADTIFLEFGDQEGLSDVREDGTYFRVEKWESEGTEVTSIGQYNEFNSADYTSVQVFQFENGDVSVGYSNRHDVVDPNEQEIFGDTLTRMSLSNDGSVEYSIVKEYGPDNVKSDLSQLADGSFGAFQLPSMNVYNIASGMQEMDEFLKLFEA